MNKCKRLVMILTASIAASLAACGQLAFAIPPTNTIVDDGGGGGGDGISTAEITKEHIVRNSYYRILHNCFTRSLRSPISFVGVTFPDADRGDEQVFNDDSTAHEEFPTGFIDDAVYCAGKNPGLLSDARDGILTQIKPYVKNSTPLSVVSPNLVEPNIRESYYTKFGYVGSYSGSGGSNDDGGAPANPASEAYCLSISFQTDQVSGKSSDLCMTLDDNKVITGMYQEGTSQVTNRSGQPIDTFQISLNGVYNGTEYNSDFYYNAFANCGKPYMCIAVVFLNITGDEYYPQEYYGTDLVPYLDTTNGDANYDALLLNLNSYINSGLVAPLGSSEFYRPASLSMVYDLRKVEVGESGGEGDDDQGPTLVMNDTYTNNDGEAGYNKLYGLIQGDGLQKDMAAFDNTELFYIYTDYLSKIYGAKIGFNTCSDNDDSSGTVMYVPTVVRNENNVKKMKYCIIDNWSSIQYQGKHKIRIHNNMETKNSSTEDLIALLKGVAGSATVSRLPANQSTASDLGDPVIPEETTDPSQPAETEPSCASRAGELGWILCPLIKGAGDILKGFFENWIEPFLVIDAQLLSDANSGVFQAWQGFQAIANLVFVVIFLFVIFSQLTGVGIDNYGIKKVLPKLIIGAILINLSYIICQLAVDISNIVGHAMKGFFGSLPPSVGGVQIRVNGGEGTGALEAGAFILTGIVAALVAQKVLTMGIMVIIPILIMVLTLVFSLFFLFFMLGLRQALAIVLVTISPLAFVCYILPNTKSLFKKWTDLFKAMLLAYPIASALVWGGDLVSRILISANAAAGTPGVVESLGLLVTAAIVSIAPVFAIPSLLKKSLSAVDGVGNMLGRVQAGGRTGAKRTGEGLQNSRVGQHMQNWQNSRNKVREDNRTLRRAGLRRNADGSVSLTARGRRQNEKAAREGDGLLGGRAAYRRRIAESRNAAIGVISADNNSGRILTEGGVGATLAGMNTKQSQQEVADEIVNMAKDTGNYDIDTMQNLLQDLMSKDSLTSEETVRAHALASKLSETGFGAKGLAKIFSSSKTTSAARQEMASYITSTDVANKVGSKDMYVAQYMRDVVANPGKYGNMSFDDWAVDSSNHTYKDENGVVHKVSNVENVAKNILDDDELLAKQATSSLQRTMEVDQMHSDGDVESGIYIDSDGHERKITIGITNKDAVSSGRAKKIIENENIHTKEEQDDLLGRRANNQQIRKINPTPPPAP